MPAVFQQDFTVRQYECDAFGHLNNVNYVRYMQEAALGASAAVGWDMARYVQAGTQWIIRETDVTYLLPLRYGDTVTLKTWVEDFRRVRSVRRYEFYCAGVLVAHASTDWVYVDVASGRPAAIPPQMLLDFRPEGDPPALLRERFPEPPAPPADIFTHTTRVQWRDIDVQGHANNAAYLAYIEDTFQQVGLRYGWGVQRLIAKGVAAVVRQWRVQYLASARLDDEIAVDTVMSDPRRISFVRHYTLRRVVDGTLLARARALCVFVDLATHKPVRAPAGILEDFAANRAGEPAP
jgi:acyl-CoA thioester hydrolase